MIYPIEHTQDLSNLTDCLKRKNSPVFAIFSSAKCQSFSRRYKRGITTIDEEMAEAYASNEWTPYALYDGYYSYNDVIRDDIKQAFLAGLKAGKNMAEADLATVAYMQGAERYKTKWHNVADGDLPPEYEEVLNGSGTKVMLVEGHWRYVHGDDWEDDASVDHWCEIPIFMEEKKNDT